MRVQLSSRPLRYRRRPALGFTPKEMGRARIPAGPEVFINKEHFLPLAPPPPSRSAAGSAVAATTMHGVGPGTNFFSGTYHVPRVTLLQYISVVMYRSRVFQGTVLTRIRVWAHGCT